MAAGWRGEGGQHQGARPYQEDSWALRALGDGSLLAVVADGMGGHAGGAVASRVAVDAFVGTVEQGGGLREGLDAANAAIGRTAAGKVELTGMGATLVGARVHGDEVHWISVGDSPFFLATAGRLERLNADHSMAPQIEALVKRGMLTAEEAENHPSRHILREAVMGQPLSLIDTGSRRLGRDVTLLMCSDGVHSISEAAIAARAVKPAKDLIDAVLAAAKAHQDNVTVIKLERTR